MDTSSSSLEAEASFSNDKKHDVFLSFSAQDTRKNFTDHLYWALKDHRVSVYRDEEELKRGEPMSEMMQGIERSRIAVIVFSSSYSNSRWCLEELVKIMECRRTLGQMVLPIFYDVHPSDVRHQTGSFALAFGKHEQRSPQETVQLWRKALAEGADLASGRVFSTTDGSQGKFIMEIVRIITTQLKRVNLDVAKYLVGIDSHVQEISNYLEVGGLSDVRIIGIWGMGGVGKTEVAKAIFNKYHQSFDGKSFLLDIRGKALIDLQEQLLFDILQPANIEVSSVDEGIDKIEKSLGSVRALVIFDDIDCVEQLDALAIKRDTFGFGSRIIVTTRNKHLLKILEVDDTYSMRAMNKEEALELLSWHAFGNHGPPNEEYLQLSRAVVDECGDLPLALAVLGRSLSKRSTNAWKSALDRLRRLPFSPIFETLKLSYDNIIDDDVKAIFLDISCFFIGMNKNYVIRILDGCDLYPEIGIGELQDRCLVTVDKEGNLMMHDLLQELGKEIVCAPYPHNPGKRSRLWNQEDVIHVLRNESGTEEIEGLSLDLETSDQPSFSTEAFREMQRLRLLKLNYVKLTGSYKHLSTELRWLCWHGFPLEAIPEDFNQTNLVTLDLSCSKLTRVWENSNLFLEKLKSLNLSHSHCLTQTPDFSNLPNLEQLILKGCCNLTDDAITKNLGSLISLADLHLENNSFCSLPSLSGLSKLEILCLNDCTNLRAIPNLPTNLKVLQADCCPALEAMPDFSEMSNIRELYVRDSFKLFEIPGLDKSLSSMTTVHMEGCINLTDSFKDSILKEWTSCGYDGIFLYGNYIPELFKLVGDKHNQIYFEVPQIFSSNLKRLTLCIVYSSHHQEPENGIDITIANHTKGTSLHHRIAFASGRTYSQPEDEYIWQGQLSNDKLSLHGGDKVSISVMPALDFVRVKKTGVNLVWDKVMNDNKQHDPELVDK